jgi:hypothetical protein
VLVVLQCWCFDVLMLVMMLSAAVQVTGAAADACGG